MGDIFPKLGSRALPRESRISAWAETPACTSHIRKVVLVTVTGINLGSEDSWSSAPPLTAPSGRAHFGYGHPVSCLDVLGK